MIVKTLVLKASRILSFVFMLIMALALNLAYGLYLQESNEYMGYVSIDAHPEYWLRLLVCVSISAFMIPAKITRPSDFFFLFYGALVFVPYAVLHPISGPVEFEIFWLNIGLLLLPTILVSLIARGGRPIKFPSVLRIEFAFKVAMLAAILGAAYVFFNAPSSAGFDIDSSYVRRLEARDIFMAGSLGAYASSITMNGLLPVIALYAGLQARSRWLIVALFGAAIFYFTLGVKAHVLMIGLGFLLGRNMRLGRLSSMHTQMGLLVMLLFLIFFIEYIFFEYSYVGDYLLRRLFSIPPFLLSAYFDLVVNPLQGWKFWFGVDAPDGVTYLVGDLYLNDPDANANTNGFIHRLAGNGAPMYVAAIILVGLVFKVIDSCHALKRNGVFMGIGFIFGVLLVEQGATTALLSSGVGLLLLLFLLSGKRVAAGPSAGN